MTTTTEALPLHEDMDAARWAREFSARYIISTAEGVEADQFGLMVGWFANAIMAGFDTANRHNRAALAQPQPSAPAETTGQRVAWTAVMQALDEVAPGWCDGADAPMNLAVAAIRRMAQPSAPSVEPAAWAVLWGLGAMRMNSVHIERATAEQVAAQIKSFTEVRPLIYGAAPTAQAPQPAMTFAQWADALTTEDRYDFDGDGRGYKKDSGSLMRLAWDAAIKACGAAPLMANGLTPQAGCKTPDGCRENGCLGWCDEHAPQAATASVAGPPAVLDRSDIASAKPAVAAPELVKPDGRLHADGCFTWARRDGYAMDKRLPCDFYLGAPVVKESLTSAALAQPAPQVAPTVPEGWVLVPVELLKDAAESIDDYRHDFDFSSHDLKLLGRLKAAMAAAPQEPQR